MRLVNRIFRQGALGMMLVTLGVGLGAAFVKNAKHIAVQLQAGDVSFQTIPIYLIGISLFGLSIYTSRRRRSFRPTYFLSVYAIAFLALHVAFFLIIRPQLISDFSLMWEYAVQIASTHTPIDVGESIIWQRAVPFLIPLARVFGANAIVYQLGNTLILLASCLFVYDLLRREYCRQVAQTFLIITLCIPDLTLATGIASHDISGLFGLTVFLWAFVAAYRGRLCNGMSRSWRQPIGYLRAVSLLTVMLLFLEVQRQTAIFAVGGVLVVLMIELSGQLFAKTSTGTTRSRNAIRTAFAAIGFVIAPFFLVQAAKPWLHGEGLVISRDAESYYRDSWLVAYGDSYSPGVWESGTMMVNEFVSRKPFSDLDNHLLHKEIRELGLNKTASDLVYHYFHRPFNYVERSKILFQFGGDQWFYWQPAETQRELADQIAPYLEEYKRIFFVLFSMIGVTGILFLGAIRSLRQTKLVFVYVVSLMVLAFLLLGEGQPRYIFPVWFAVGGVVAAAPRYIGGRIWGRSWTDRYHGLQRQIQETSVALVIIVGLYVLTVFCLALIYGIPEGRIISRWDRVISGTTVGREAVGADAAGLQRNIRIGAIDRSLGKLATSLQVKGMRLQGDYLQVEKEICTGSGDRRNLAFYFIPEPVGKTAAEILLASVLINGETVWREPLSEEKHSEEILKYKVPIPEGCFTLAARLAVGKGNGESVDVDGSAFHLVFPRLVTGQSG